MPEIDFFALAAAEARQSLCQRGHCGAIVVKDGAVVGRGYNAPPQNDTSFAQCHRDQRLSRKPKSDRTCCVHAEWRALIAAVRRVGDITGSTLYFARVDDAGAILPSQEPYCTVCSRLALDLGVHQFGLLHKTGSVLYDTVDYNRRSYEYHDVPLPNT